MRLATITIDGKRFTYKPIVPCADCEQFAADTARLMFRHERNEGGGLFIAPKDELTSGWVLGTCVMPD